MGVAVEAAVGAREVAADVEGDGAAAEFALAAGAVGAAGLRGGMELLEEVAVNAPLDREAGLAACLKGEAEIGSGRAHLCEEVPAGVGVALVGLDAGGGEAASWTSLV